MVLILTGIPNIRHRNVSLTINEVAFRLVMEDFDLFSLLRFCFATH